MNDQGPQGKVDLTLPPPKRGVSFSVTRTAASSITIFGMDEPIEMQPGKTVWVTVKPKHPTLYRLGLSRKLVWVQG